MISPISIDLSGLIEEFQLKEAQSEALATALLNQITDNIFYNWSELAKKGLNSTRKQYLQGLNIQNISPTKKSIQLTGEFPNAIESGMSAFDMKNGFLASPKAKNGKLGKYITIPFRFAVSGSIGESEVFAAVMPKKISDIAKTLTPTTSTVGNVTRGDRIKFDQIPQQYQTPNSRASIVNEKGVTTYPQYTHKGSIYEGITKNQKTYENATQNSYVSFRRVSQKSDPMAFIHKGIEAKDFANKAFDKTDIGHIVDSTINEFLK